MYSIISFRYIFTCLILLVIYSSVIIRYNLYRTPFNLLQNDFRSHCFQWQSVDHQFSTMYMCPHYSYMNTLVWTFDGTGIMKYIQWIVIRKLANIRITRFNNDCHISQNYYFSSNSRDNRFIQIFILSLSANFTDGSTCSIKMNQMTKINLKDIQEIYFKRRSIEATVFYQLLDQRIHNQNLNFSSDYSFQESVKKAGHITNHFPKYFASSKWTFIDSEDLIKANLNDCERVLMNFLSLLRLNTPAQTIKSIVTYDSHQFIEDATWWDQSEVAERILTRSIPHRSSNFTYSNDFYYLHGDQSFTQYLFRNRQCYNDGIFAQMQFKTKRNRSSTYKPERCSSKSFDCAFSDLYSFSDREQIYQQFDTNHYFNEKSLKCGFAIPSVFDRIRNQYGRNQTCQTIIFTLVTNCYDPLPEVKGVNLPSFCFVALLDTRTANAYKKFYKNKSNTLWEIIDLGVNATPFSVAAKSTETLKIVGERMFPLAKWIIWLDGKARINDISRLLLQAQAPVLGPAHPDRRRTSANEVNPTIKRLRVREKTPSQRLNNSILDILLQEKEYQRDGFYALSDSLRLSLYDIVIFIYRNNHPCISRYLCGWHNEINYFSYRGQLSVYYSAVRLNLTNYLHFLPRKFYSSVRHRAVC